MDRHTLTFCPSPSTKKTKTIQKNDYCTPITRSVVLYFVSGHKNFTQKLYKNRNRHETIERVFDDVDDGLLLFFCAFTHTLFLQIFNFYMGLFVLMHIQKRIVDALLNGKITSTKKTSIKSNFICNCNAYLVFDAF